MTVVSFDGSLALARSLRALADEIDGMLTARRRQRRMFGLAPSDGW